MSAAVAKAPHLFSDGSSVRVLTFDVRVSKDVTLEMAINIQKIKEIIETDDFKIQALTSKFYPIVGMINLRSSSIPILDLNYFLTGASAESFDHSRNYRIIVCEFQKLQLGIIVEKTHKIRQFDNSLVHKVPDVVAGMNNNIFNGILEIDNRFVKLLDIEYILTMLNVDVAPEPQGSMNLALSGKKVLVVEDSRLFQKKLVQFFTEKGAEVMVAEDGIQGLEILESGSFRPDLIFTDIEMPRLNGIGMVRKIQSIDSIKNIPVIFNTSISNQGLIEDIESEGLGDYIVKFDELEIVKSIKRIFNSDSI